MIYYTLKRLGLALLVALTVSFISFGLLYLSSDPAIAMAGETASDADIEAIRFSPILSIWIGYSALSGDLGKSYYRTDVSALISEATNHNDAGCLRHHLCHCAIGAAWRCRRHPSKQPY